jgi:heme-degrading monooxygenase HmoA
VFCVIFEVCPHAGQHDAYLGLARMLRPELEQVDGFIDNVRYRSLTRDGWILSISTWRDELAVVRWRTSVRHHDAQQKGRDFIFADYHLRVGEVTPGEEANVMLIDASRPADSVNAAGADAVARGLGLVPDASGLVAWDVFDALLTPGDVLLLLSWRDTADAGTFERGASLPEHARMRRVRLVRDYGMFDRRAAPQQFAPIDYRRSRS